MQPPSQPEISQDINYLRFEAAEIEFLQVGHAAAEDLSDVIVETVSSHMDRHILHVCAEKNLSHEYLKASSCCHCSEDGHFPGGLLHYMLCQAANQGL